MKARVLTTDEVAVQEIDELAKTKLFGISSSYSFDYIKYSSLTVLGQYYLEAQPKLFHKKETREFRRALVKAKMELINKITEANGPELVISHLKGLKGSSESKGSGGRLNKALDTHIATLTQLKADHERALPAPPKPTHPSPTKLPEVKVEDKTSVEYFKKAIETCLTSTIEELDRSDLDGTELDEESKKLYRKKMIAEHLSEVNRGNVKKLTKYEDIVETLEILEALLSEHDEMPNAEPEAKSDASSEEPKYYYGLEFDIHNLRVILKKYLSEIQQIISSSVEEKRSTSVATRGVFAWSAATTTEEGSFKKCKKDSSSLLQKDYKEKLLNSGVLKDDSKIRFAELYIKQINASTSFPGLIRILKDCIARPEFFKPFEKRLKAHIAILEKEQEKYSRSQLASSGPAPTNPPRPNGVS